MNSNKQMAVKQTNTNLLDTVVPDINVPIMKQIRENRVNDIDLIPENGSKMLSNKQVCR